METEKTKEQLQSYHCVQLCMPDANSVPRGKVVTGKFKDDLANISFDMFRGIPLLGPNCEVALTVPQLTAVYESHQLRPCMETLTPWPWASKGGRRVGNILFDMYMPDGSRDLNCPRQQLKKQLDTLWQKNGLVIKAAFEYEFYVYHTETLKPLGGERRQLCDLRVWAENQTLVNELQETIESMGIKISMVQCEYSPGQWEFTTIPYEGVHAADVCFYVKNAIKGFFAERGYSATFMSKPGMYDNGNGMHLNHSLWKPVSQDNGEKPLNVFLGKGSEIMSTTARHWLAGNLVHARAVTALQCPSLNCYRRLFRRVSPSLCVWGVNNRHALIRAKVEDNNMYFENRLVSGAASPYFALASTIAAGMDGLQRRLECPKPMNTSEAEQLPQTLEQALDCLEEDRELVEILGEDFVDCYVNSKRETEVAPYKKANLKTEEDELAYERAIYFKLY